MALALAAAHPACTNARDTSKTFGGGPTVYRNYDLRPMTPDGLMAAAVIGFSTVETLRVTDEMPAAAPVVAPVTKPPCDGMPVAIVPGDYDADGVLDLWTQEPCGNWISTGPDYRLGVMSAALLPTDPGPYEYVDYFDILDGAIVLGGATHFAYMLRRAGSVWSEPAWLQMPSPVAVRVTNVWVPLNVSDKVPEFLFQGHEMLRVVKASESEPIVARDLAQSVEPPYLQPFAAFDHLTALDPKVCPAVVLGIGVFVDRAGKQPRRLQVLHLDDTSYRVAEPPIWLDDVTTFSVLVMADGTLLVGALGRRGDRSFFVLGALEDCAEFETLAELEIEFDVRTPPLPEWYEESLVPLTEAVSLVPFANLNRAYFAHYDGFDLRVVAAEQNESGWQLEERRHEIHSKRSDSSFDERITDDAAGL